MNFFPAMDKKLTRAASLDLLIMLDCTTSMMFYIQAAKNRIRTFVKTIGETYPDIPLRIGFIGYRDNVDGVNRRVILPFQKDLSAFETLLGGIHTFGGGNPLTDLTGALQAAADQDWASAIRVLFHIGDYPCHGTKYHDNLYDRYPAGDPDGLVPEEFVKRLQDQKVTYCFGQLTTYTDKMIRLFNEHVGGKEKYIRSAPMSSATMMEVITSSVTALLTTSLSSTSSTDSGVVNPRECELLLEMPKDWSHILAERAVAYSLAPVTSMDLLCGTGDEKVTEDFPDVHHVQLQCVPQPFGKGRSKLAYYARTSDRLAHFNRIPANVMVLKDSVYTSRTYATKEKFEEYLAPQRAALYLSARYNEVHPPNTPAIEFVTARLLQFLARSNRPYFIEETYIPGAWERFNNNTGYCAPFPTALGTHHEAVQAFSHWTHHVSGGRLMITDCQGCFDAARNAFVLTDPAVHCVSLLAYGGTNMGAKGFERFFKTHRCNDICQRLDLIPQAVHVHGK